MDATVTQADGYRFVYVLPLTATRLLVEDTYYADGPALEEDRLRAAIADYLATQGWRAGDVVREERGVLPIAIDGDIEAFWGDKRGVPAVGLAAGLFHPTTGYSLPDAVRTADLIAGLPELTTEAVFAALRRHAVATWRARGFFRMLNRLLFFAGVSSKRYLILQHFYRLPDPLIARFYAAKLRTFDKITDPHRQAAGALRQRAEGPRAASADRRTRVSATERLPTPEAARRAVVIGAGFGGLALAIRLQAAGIATTLVEKRDKPGGRAYVYQDQGFTFDAGPTVITDPSALEELFQVAGRKLADYVELLPVDPFYRLCWEDGRFFDYANDQDALDRQIASAEPEGRRGLPPLPRLFAGGVPRGLREARHRAVPAVPRHGAGRTAAGAARRLGAASIPRSPTSSRTNSSARPSRSTRCSSAAIRSRPPRSTR